MGELANLKSEISRHQEAMKGRGSHANRNRAVQVAVLARAAEDAGEPVLAIRALHLWLRCVSDNSRHGEVLATADRGLSLCVDTSFDEDRLRFLLAKGRRFLRLLALESAMLVLREADLVAARLDDRAAGAEVLRQMGMLHGLAGDLDLSEASFRRAVEAFRTTEDRGGYAEALGGLAIAFWKQGHLEKAYAELSAAVEVAREAENWPSVIHILANLANYHLERRDLEKADETLVLAEQVFRENDIAPYWGWALLLANRGSYFSLTGQSAKAIGCLEEALSLCAEIDEELLRPLLERELSRFLREQGDYQVALDHLEIAYQLDLENAKRGRSIELLSLRGFFELAQEQNERKLVESHRSKLLSLVDERTQELQTEILERREAEARARHLALHDPLTGLANRILFTRALAGAIESAKARGSALALLFVDLNNFKQINDARGHEKGDRLLRQIADRLIAMDNSADSVCRFGGDEFILLVEDSDAPGAVEARSDEIHSVFAAPFMIGADEQRISVCIGVSRYPVHSKDSSQLIRFADMAMFVAKRKGGGTTVEFSEGMREEHMLRLDLQREFHDALRDGDIHLVYQPKVRTSDRAVVGYEALARWEHAHYGSIPPARFVPLLEENGLIRELGRWVIETACAQIRLWQNSGAGPLDVPLHIAVNVSQRQLQDGNLPEFIKDCLRRHHLNGSALEIELTESSLMHETTEVIERLTRISAEGVGVVVDDFGTGYSSLSLVSQLPIDGIKIDQSFIRSMLVNPTDRMIVETIIRMAKALRKVVIAEGVENEAEFEMLRAEGCDYCQGFLFGAGTPARADLAHLSIVASDSTMQR